MANYKTYRIGDVVELCTETNSDLKYGLEHVRGISNTKEIQQTKANLIERNLAPFHVVRRNEFVYNRRTSRNGERVGLGFNNTDETLLITEDYVHFRVKDENQLNPDYLYLFFKRDEFDREARYNSWGSATEFFNWDDMQAIKINVPPIEEQRRIVSEYQTVERRIQNNEQLIKKLEETAQAIYHHTFVEGIDENNLPEGWQNGCLGDVTCCFDSQRKPVAGYNRANKDAIYPYYGATSIMDYVDEYIFDGEYILMGEDGSVMDEEGFPILQYVRGKMWINNHAHVLQGKGLFNNNILYWILKNTIIKNFITGAVQLKLNQKNMNSIPVIIPPDYILVNVQKQINPVMDYLYVINCENSHLRTLLSLLTSKLS